MKKLFLFHNTQFRRIINIKISLSLSNETYVWYDIIVYSININLISIDFCFILDIQQKFEVLHF